MANEFLKDVAIDIGSVIEFANGNNKSMNDVVEILKEIRESIYAYIDGEAKYEVVEEDLINRPSHYTREDAIECIDEMRLIFGDKAVMDFCKCNAWKYRYRAGQKKGEDGEKDIKKSDWYMRKFQELHTLADDELPWA